MKNLCTINPHLRAYSKLKVLYCKSKSSPLKDTEVATESCPEWDLNPVIESTRI